MSFSYKRLFILLIERDISKGQLKEMIDVSSSTMAKLAKGEIVSLDVLNRICDALDCKIEDIVEHVKDEKQNT